MGDPAWILDLSATAAQVVVVEKVESGALFPFNLHVSTLSDTLEAMAADRWCKDDHSIGGENFRVGLEFRRLPDDRRKMIGSLRKWFEKRRARKSRSRLGGPGFLRRSFPIDADPSHNHNGQAKAGATGVGGRRRSEPSPPGVSGEVIRSIRCAHSAFFAS